MATAPTGPTIGVAGLGAMGLPIATSLAAAGYRVFGSDVEPGRLASLEQVGGTSAVAFEAIVDQASIILTVLPSAEALLDVVDRITSNPRGPRSGMVLVEMSTLALHDKMKARDRLERAGVQMLDCPLSGTAVQAAVGDLVVYGSGDPAVFETCRGVLSAVARSVHYLGPFGVGTRTKLVANLLVAVHIVAAAEGLALANRAGLDLDVTLAALTDGAGSSRMLEVRGPMMVQSAFDTPSMSIHLFQKDLALIREMAGDLGLSIPMLDAASHWYEIALAEGRGGQDTSAVYATMDRLARTP
jgi:putative dehydrogenase